ncbi:hypothetical protein [Nocardioides sp. W7]|uniref:hypothetical protein n=1 Tax=Nocardioides sp. W7 TaxID=2931390 RepID=UPI001FD5BC85|nr:hypothetical protein [Nocardioides sp. W7]
MVVTTTDDLLATIWSALDSTGVWVSPELAPAISPADLAAIEDAVADSPVPIFVVVQRLADGDAFGGEPEELLTQLHDRYDADGLYLAPRFYGSGTDQLTLVDRSWGTALEARDAVSVAEHRHGDGEGKVDDLGVFLADTTRLLADGTAAAAYEEEVVPTYTSTAPSSPEPTGPADSGDGLPAAGVVGAGLVLALALVAVALAVRRRRTPRTFTLPASVVSQVREAQADRIEQQARGLVLELGEAVRSSDLDKSDDTEAWQAALDHYDGATRVLDGADDLALLDAVGALVLARQGRAALDAANSGNAFQPLRLCYLNPLHESPGRTPMRLEQGGHTLDVPVCRSCRADLKAGRDPDALRVERSRRAVLYVDSGVEPWASSAYGALGTSLVSALHRRP